MQARINNVILGANIFIQILMNASPVIMTALITVPTRQDPMSAHVGQAILWQMMASPVMVSILKT